MLALTEKQMLVAALGRIVVDEVQMHLAPIKEQIAQFQKILGDMPVPQNGIDGIDGKDGKNGTDGIDGKDADLSDVAKMIESATDNAQQWVRDYVQGVVDALPKAEKGERGEKGEQGEPGKPGRDGINGRDGADGKSISLDDVRDVLADFVAQAVGDIPVPRNCTGGYIDRHGHLFLSFSDGCNSDLGEVVGRDGKDCDFDLVRSQVATFLAAIEKPKDGKDGVGFDDLSIEYDGERLVTFKFVKGENAKVFNLEFPIPIYRGIWRQGDYAEMDVTVRDGAMWIAKKDTKSVPGSPDSDWQLCTKRGQNGKDGKQGPQGPEGKAGRDGRDLTQLGFDGRKY